MRSLKLKIQHKEDYRQRRKSEYPATGDQLDAVYKLAIALQQVGIDLPDDVTAWINEIESIKAKYPKS